MLHFAYFLHYAMSMRLDPVCTVESLKIASTGWSRPRNARLAPLRSYPNRRAPFFASQCAKAVFTRIFIELSRSSATFFNFLCSTRGIVIVVSLTIALFRANQGSACEIHRIERLQCHGRKITAIADQRPQRFVDAFVQADGEL